MDELKSPAKRHFAAKVGQSTLAREVNSVVDTTVDVAGDVKAIRSGKAQQVEGDFMLENGRMYGLHDGTLYPISGPGIYQLNRGAFKALGVLNKFGHTHAAKDILDKMGVTKEALRKALTVYHAINQ